jgi:hypothetical protein
MTTRLGIRLLFAALLGTFAVASQAAQVPSSTDQPKEDLPTIIQSFRAATLTRDSLGSVLDSTSGVSRDYAQELLAQRDDDIRASALAFANAVEELSGEGLDVADARRSMSDAVNEDWPRYQSQLKKRTKDLARLNRDSDALSGAERVAIETEMSEQSDQLLRAYQSLVDVTLALEGAGVDVSKQRKFLVDGLPAAAEGLVTRVQLAGRARANALARLSRDASSADLRFMLEASDERLRRASAGLSMAILLMDRLRLPTTALRVSRITTTGKLSADVFQWPVFWGWSGFRARSSPTRCGRRLRGGCSRGCSSCSRSSCFERWRASSSAWLSARFSTRTSRSCGVEPARGSPRRSSC